MKNNPLADTVERVACVYRHFREWAEPIHDLIIYAVPRTVSGRTAF